MLIDIAAIVFILAIAFYQAIHGTFSSLIMAILSILSAAAALNFYEPLATVLNARLGAYAPSVAMLALFAIPLLLLRTLFDRVIRGNVLLGLWPDRVGGGIFGLITAGVLIGMFVLVVMTLPMPASFLGYHPYDASLEVEDGGGARKSANFVLALARSMSAGALAPVNRPQGGETFGQAHDDLFLESFCLRNRPSGGRASAPDNALQVKGAYRLFEPDATGGQWKGYVQKLRDEQLKNNQQIKDVQDELTAVYDQTPKYPLVSAMAETRLYVVRVAVDQDARNEKDNWYRLPATHFRLVTDTHQSYWPVGYLTYAGRWRVETGGATLDKAKPADVLVARPWDKKEGPARLQVDWLYRLPVKEKPREMIFRRTARAAIRTPVDGLPPWRDEKGNIVALTVMPVPRKVDFDKPSAARVIRPVRMEVRGGMFNAYQFQLRQDNSKADIYRDADMGATWFNSGKVAATREEINANTFANVSDRTIYQFRPPHTGDWEVIQLYCQMNDTYPSARDAAAMLAGLDPKLILSDGRRIEHRGAYIDYGPQQSRAIFLYYEPLDSEKLHVDLNQFRRVLTDNRTKIAEKEGLGFVFLIPSGQKASIVGASLGEGPNYDFYSQQPMIPSKR